MLTEAQREAYERDGFLAVPALVGPEWLDPLRALTAALIDESRAAPPDDWRFDTEPDHAPDRPRLRRLNSPTDVDDGYWQFASRSPIVDLAQDLLGPDLKFHHSKLNFKEAHGGEEVQWHQDIQFWPHTNYSLLTIGVFLEDVSEAMGNVGFVPGSHAGALFDLYDGDRWAGAIQPADLERVATETAVYPTGPAGSVTVHSCRTVHGSAPNRSERPRPLLLNTYAAADAMAYTDLVRASRHGEEIVRGRQPRWIRHDPRPCLLPPSGYRPIFAVQQQEPT